MHCFITICGAKLKYAVIFASVLLLLLFLRLCLIKPNVWKRVIENQQTLSLSLCLFISLYLSLCLSFCVCLSVSLPCLLSPKEHRSSSNSHQVLSCAISCNPHPKLFISVVLFISVYLNLHFFYPVDSRELCY